MTNQDKLQSMHERANEVKQDIQDLRNEGLCDPRDHSDVIRSANRILKATNYEDTIFTRDWASLAINYKMLYNPDVMEKLKAFLK